MYRDSSINGANSSPSFNVFDHNMNGMVHHGGVCVNMAVATLTDGC